MPDRRQMLFGLAAAGLALTETSAEAAVTASAPVAGGAAANSLQHDMQPCRFGAIHYRFVKPARPTKAVPMLCLHASPASAIGFADFLPLMGTDRLAIAPDNPGFGLSDRPSTPSTIADFAGAIWDLMDALKIKTVDLVGSNTGSATAVEMALQRPAAVRRIVLHTAPMFTPQEVAGYQSRLSTSASPDLEAAAASLPERWKKFAPLRVGLSDDVAWQLFWEMNRDPIHRSWGHDAAFAYDFAGALRQVRHPVLILNPQDGMSAVTARAKGVRPNIAVMDLPWSGYPFTTYAVETAGLIRQHLDA
jgi:pimeloyl-ACP methyl ester carboxylesterase